MDWMRYLRALAAQGIQRVEYQRNRWFKDKTIELDPDDWSAIVEHDRWLGEDGI